MTQLKLEATVRKFIGSRGKPKGSKTYQPIPGGHPDFERQAAMEARLVTGLVMPQLGPDRKPVFSGKAQPSISNEAAFRQWFDSAAYQQWCVGVDGIVREQKLFLTLTEDPNVPGLFRYNSNPGTSNVPETTQYHGFFPLDAEEYIDKFPPVWVDSRVSPPVTYEWLAVDQKPRNFHFTMELHHKFTYTEAAKDWVFQFTGDDDLWVFIANQLVIDIGGVHRALTQSVRLGDLKVNDQGVLDPNGTKPLLEVGKDYPFDLFYAERHTERSDFFISTSIFFNPKVTIDATDPQAQEPAPGQFATLDQYGEFTIRMDKPFAEAMLVQYQIGGSAIWGSDYRLYLKDASGSLVQEVIDRVTIPAGQTEVKIAVVPGADGASNEADFEDVVLTLVDGDRYDLGTDISDIVNIADYIQPPTVPLASLSATIDIAREPIPGQVATPEQMGEFTIRLDKPAPQPLWVKFVLSGNAVWATDYRLFARDQAGNFSSTWLVEAGLSNGVTIPAGWQEVRIAVVPIGDATVEGGEDVIMTLDADDSDPYDLGDQISDMVLITDTTAPPRMPIAMIKAIQDEAWEPVPGGAGVRQPAIHGIFVVYLDSIATENVRISYRLEGDALHNSDYVLRPANLRVVIPQGERTARITVIPLGDRIQEDGINNKGERVTAVLEVGDGYRPSPDETKTKAHVWICDLEPEPEPKPEPQIGLGTQGAIGSAGGGTNVAPQPVVQPASPTPTAPPVAPPANPNPTRPNVGQGSGQGRPRPAQPGRPAAGRPAQPGRPAQAGRPAPAGRPAQPGRPAARRRRMRPQ